MSAGAEVQHQSDQLMLELGLQQCTHIAQIFFKEQGKLVLLVAKIIDDLMVAGFADRAEILVKVFDRNFELGAVSHGPEKIAILWDQHYSERKL